MSLIRMLRTYLKDGSLTVNKVDSAVGPCTSTKAETPLPFVLTDQVTKNKKPLPKGVVILRSFLSIGEQNALVQMFQDFRSPTKDAYIPHFKLKDSYGFGSLYLYSLGYHWDAKKGMYSKVRGDVDNSAVPDIPPILHEIYAKIFAPGTYCNEVFPNAAGELPTNALLNYYPPEWGSLGEHQDRHEKVEMPIVSISIGDEVDFEIKDFTTKKFTTHSKGPNDRGDKHLVTLQSGDIIIFGNENRMMYHTIAKFYRDRRPKELNMIGGRINMTLRHLDLNRKE
jgi:alkylated DNA repair protein (DNA oxidative demethylase)